MAEQDVMIVGWGFRRLPGWRRLLRRSRVRAEALLDGLTETRAPVRLDAGAEPIWPVDVAGAIRVQDESSVDLGGLVVFEQKLHDVGTVEGRVALFRALSAWQEAREAQEQAGRQEGRPLV